MIEATKQSAGWKLENHASRWRLWLPFAAVRALRALAELPLPDGSVTKEGHCVGRAVDNLARAGLVVREPDSPRWRLNGAGWAVHDAINTAQEGTHADS